MNNYVPFIMLMEDLHLGGRLRLKVHFSLFKGSLFLSAKKVRRSIVLPFHNHVSRVNLFNSCHRPSLDSDSFFFACESSRM